MKKYKLRVKFSFRNTNVSSVQTQLSAEIFPLGLFSRSLGCRGFLALHSTVKKTKLLNPSKSTTSFCLEPWFIARTKCEVAGGNEHHQSWFFVLIHSPEALDSTAGSGRMLIPDQYDQNICAQCRWASMITLVQNSNGTVSTTLNPSLENQFAFPDPGIFFFLFAWWQIRATLYPWYFWNYTQIISISALFIVSHPTGIPSIQVSLGGNRLASTGCNIFFVSNINLYLAVLRVLPMKKKAQALPFSPINLVVSGRQEVMEFFQITVAANLPSDFSKIIVEAFYLQHEHS